MRTCIACRRRREVRAGEVLRLVVDRNGRPLVAAASSGRGAWVCADDQHCLRRATTPKVLGRALRVPVDDASADALRRMLLERFPVPSPDARD